MHSTTSCRGRKSSRARGRGSDSGFGIWVSRGHARLKERRAARMMAVHISCRGGHMRAALLLAIALSSVVASAADVTIVETLSVTAGGKTIRGTLTTYISGERMRIDAVLPDQSASTLYDLPAGSIVGLDAKANRAELFPLAPPPPATEKQY